MLRDALTKKFSDNPLYKEREDATTNYMNSLTTAPQSVGADQTGGVILNPQQQGDLIKAHQNAALSHIGTLNQLLSLQTGGIENTIGAASAAQQARTTGLQGQQALAQENYKNILDKLSKQAEAGYHQQDIELKLKELNQRYQLSPMGLLQQVNGMDKNGLPGQSGTNTSSNPTRDMYRQKYNQLLTVGLKDAADAVKTQYEAFGKGPLNPTPLSSEESSKLSENRNTLNLIDEAETIMNKNPNLVGGFMGSLKSILPSNILAKISDKDTQRLYDIFTSLSTAGQRILIGGKDSGYLFNKLNPAFPTLDKSAGKILPELQAMKRAILTGGLSLANQHGIDKAEQIPGYSDLGDTNVMVKNLKTGETGYVPLKELDPKKYKEL
jgi:hypothetical protein